MAFARSTVTLLRLRHNREGYVGDAGSDHVEIAGSAFGEVDDAACRAERAAIGDADANLSTVGDALDEDPGSERERSMRGRIVCRVETLATCSLAARECVAVPGRLSRLKGR
jgi:hypothetical protein